MTLSDVLIVLSTLLSPLIAIQVSTFLSERKDKKGRKEWIYKTLMATRANNLAPVHVESLNRIALEFSSSVPSEKVVLDLWEQYLNHLGRYEKMDPKIWANSQSDLLVDLLFGMGQSLGYTFNKTVIRTGIYAPLAHGELENAQGAMRRMLLELLEGNRSLPMRVTNLPQQSQPSPPTSGAVNPQA